MEELTQKYIQLGKVLEKFYSGKHLSKEELNLIASSSDSDKLLAINLNASKKLITKNDGSYDIFRKNEQILTTLELNSVKTK